MPIYLCLWSKINFQSFRLFKSIFWCGGGEVGEWMNVILPSYTWITVYIPRSPRFLSLSAFCCKCMTTVYSSSLHKNSSWVTSGKRAAKWPLCSLFWASCTSLHYERFENCWKRLAERHLVLQTCVLHDALVEKSKDKTERCCKDQYKPMLTRCIIAFQGPALFT